MIWNKAKEVDADKTLTDHITFHTKLTNDLSKEVKLISSKKLTKYLVNRYSIFNGAKYFNEDGS